MCPFSSATACLAAPPVASRSPWEFVDEQSDFRLILIP